jgi:hypothetical protein
MVEPAPHAMNRQAVTRRICAVADLFGGHDSVAGIVVQAKIGSDNPLSCAAAPFRLRAPHRVAISVVLSVDRLRDVPRHTCRFVSSDLSRRSVPGRWSGAWPLRSAPHC